MSLDTALFLVSRGGITHHVLGSDIGSKIQNDDVVLVQRGDENYKATYSDGFEKLLESDLLLSYQGGDIYHVTGENFLKLFDG